MNSLAIWYEENSPLVDNEVPCLDLHFNHWKLHRKYLIRNEIKKKIKEQINWELKLKQPLWKPTFENTTDYFLDIGIKVGSGRNVKNVCLYFPYKILKTDNVIADLGCKLNNRDATTAIFNEDYSVVIPATPKIIELKSGTNTVLKVYQLDIPNDIKFKEEYHGTVIRFPHNDFGAIPSYYRIRIKSNFISTLSYFYRPKNAFLESAFSSIELIDFRLNDTRNLDLSLLEHIATNKKFNIRLVHYFIMRKVKDDYILSNQPLNSLRELEENTWNKYIDSDDYNYEKSLAYHLKTKMSEEDIKNGKYIQDFIALFKFRIEGSKLIKYFMYAILFALLTELIGHGLYDILSPYAGFLH